MKQFLLQTSFDTMWSRFWRLETEKRHFSVQVNWVSTVIFVKAWPVVFLLLRQIGLQDIPAMAVTAKRSKRANYYKTFFSILAMHVACHVPKSCILHMLCSQSPLLWSQDTICNLTEWKALIFIHFHVLTHFWYIDSSRNIRIFLAMLSLLRFVFT